MTDLLYPARNIDEVLAHLDAIIDDCVRHGSHLGLFASLYRRTTQQVKNAILAGHFDDGPRMDHLDTVFANRYLVAYYHWRAGQPIPLAWQAAFVSCERAPHLIYQHLLLGMNAHINLDLGLAVADIATPEELVLLHHDFLKINQILLHMIDGVQDALAISAPWLGRLDRLGGRLDELMAYRLVRHARANAWRVAHELVTTPTDLPQYVARVDRQAEGTARQIMKAGRVAHRVLNLLRIGRAPDVPALIEHLRSAAVRS
jgi:hypothetical protein